MCVYIYTCTYTIIYMYVCIRLYIHICTYIFVFICTFSTKRTNLRHFWHLLYYYICIYICIHLCIHVCVYCEMGRFAAFWTLAGHSYIFTYTHIHMYTYWHIFIYIQSRIYIMRNGQIRDILRHLPYTYIYVLIYLYIYINTCVYSAEWANSRHFWHSLLLPGLSLFRFQWSLPPPPSSPLLHLPTKLDGFFSCTHVHYARLRNMHTATRTNILAHTATHCNT